MDDYEDQLRNELKNADLPQLVDADEVTQQGRKAKTRRQMLGGLLGVGALGVVGTGWWQLQGSGAEEKVAPAAPATKARPADQKPTVKTAVLTGKVDTSSKAINTGVTTVSLAHSGAPAAGDQLTLTFHDFKGAVVGSKTVKLPAANAVVMVASPAKPSHQILVSGTPIEQVNFTSAWDRPGSWDTDASYQEYAKRTAWVTPRVQGKALFTLVQMAPDPMGQIGMASGGPGQDASAAPVDLTAYKRLLVRSLSDGNILNVQGTSLVAQPTQTVEIPQLKYTQVVSSTSVGTVVANKIGQSDLSVSWFGDEGGGVGIDPFEDDTVAYDTVKGEFTALKALILPTSIARPTPVGNATILASRNFTHQGKTWTLYLFKGGKLGWKDAAGKSRVSDSFPEPSDEEQKEIDKKKNG